MNASPSNAQAPGPGPSPLAELWTVAWPTVLTMTSFTLMQFIDALMVSAIGPTELAAQGNGGIAAFVPIAFVMGALMLTNTFVSQNLGAGRPERGVKYAWAALWMSVIAWITLIPYGLALPLIFNALHDERLARLETVYGQILLFCCVVNLSSRGLSHYFYGMHRPKVIFVATIVGNLANIAANYALIFGKFGFPALGLTGAAWGTVFGTAIEFIIPFAVFIGPMNREFGTRRQWRLDWKPIRDLIRLGWPKSLQFGNEMVCWTILTVVLVGMFGEVHIAAGWIALRYMHLSFMPAVGLSVAVTAVVGRYIGAGDADTAAARAGLGVRMAVLYMGACALVFVVFREELVRVFLALNPDERPGVEKMEAEVLAIGSRILICAAVFQVFDAIAITLSGALNGAGDTVWPGVATICSSWVFVVGVGGALALYAPQLESLGPWIGAALFIIALSILLAGRWRSGKWRSIKLLEPEDDPLNLDAATGAV
ncbi:MAG: MATE family efflux transporter [Phycisphaerales bacterium]